MVGLFDFVQGSLQLDSLLIRRVVQEFNNNVF